MLYTPLVRHAHSFHATTPITRTTQIFLDVYRHHGALYLQPSKVEHRYSPTMYMLHAWEGERFVPVTDSSTTAEILTSLPWAGLKNPPNHPHTSASAIPPSNRSTPPWVARVPAAAVSGCC